MQRSHSQQLHRRGPQGARQRDGYVRASLRKNEIASSLELCRQDACHLYLLDSIEGTDEHPVGADVPDEDSDDDVSITDSRNMVPT